MDYYIFILYTLLLQILHEYFDRVEGLHDNTDDQIMYFFLSMGTSALIAYALQTGQRLDLDLLP